jgi:hypothetical protein
MRYVPLYISKRNPCHQGGRILGLGLDRRDMMDKKEEQRGIEEGNT